MDEELARLRLPPHSIEAEQSVLGGLLLNNQAWEEVGDSLDGEAFYRLDHRLIWQHIELQIRQERPADVLTVGDSLRQVGKLDEVGGIAYLNALATGVASAANVRHYAAMVRDRAILRRLISVSDQIASTALDAQGRDVNAILDEAESRIFEIAEDNGKQRKDFHELPELLGAVFRRVDELYNRDNPSEITGVPTGLIDLDRMTSGMQPGDLVIIAARPSVGKTALALNIGEHVAVHEKLPVAVFSMEMGAEQLAMRLVSSAGRIDQQRLRTGRLTEDDFMRLTEAMRKSGRCALARWAWKTKQYVVQVRAVEDGLVLQQLLYADEVRSLKDLDIEAVAVAPAELQLALQLIDQIAAEGYDPSEYVDEEKKRVLEAIDRKIAGQQVVASAHDEAPSTGQVTSSPDTNCSHSTSGSCRAARA